MDQNLQKPGLKNNYNTEKPENMAVHLFHPTFSFNIKVTDRQSCHNYLGQLANIDDVLIRPSFEKTIMSKTHLDCKH